MTKENRDLLVNSIVVLLIGILFVFIFAVFIPKTTTDNIFGRVVKLEEVGLDDNPTIIKEKYIAKDGKREVGTVYLVEADGTFGPLKFYVGIDNKDLVSVEMIEIGQSSFAIAGLNKYVKEEFKDIPRSEVKDIEIYSVADLDASAGETASQSPTDLKSAVLTVLSFHYNEVEPTPELTELEEIYGIGAVLELDGTFIATDKVLLKNKVLVEGVLVGSIYKVKGTGLYFGPDEGSIIIEFALDNDGLYLGQIVDLDNYGHTKGFRDRALTVLAGIINTNINDIVIKDLDTSTGATNTSTIITKMLNDLKAIFEPQVELTELEEIYGIGAILELDETFTATEEVLARNEVLVEGIVVGLIYKVKGTGVYFGTNEGSIIIEFALDNDGLYLGQIVDLDNYGHTPGFRDRALTVLAGIVNTNINDLIIEDLDTSTGASNTSTIITDMLNDLKGAFQ